MFLRKTLPLIMCFIFGILAAVGFYAQEGTTVYIYYEKFAKWNSIIAAFAMLLGVGNLFRVNFMKVTRNHPDKAYSAILLVCLVMTATFGILGGVYKENLIIDDFNAVIATAAINEEFLKSNDKLITGTVNELKNRINSISDNNILVPARAFLEKYNEKSITIDTVNELKSVTALIPPISMKFFKNKCNYIYDYMIKPMQSTMMSLLAFFVASAAFRAFRAKSFEATILLVTAFIVMLGRVPIGSAIWGGFGSISEWILCTINMAGSRAITLGAAVGATAACLKIILGLETRYLGGE
ncbi:MAG: hypothetical protein QMC67_12765 [Candidatus Wallbacteria bacterium]